jgi:hypothetical protein
LINNLPNSHPILNLLANTTILTITLAPGPPCRCRVSFVGASRIIEHVVMCCCRPTDKVVPKMAKVLIESLGIREHIYHGSNPRDIPIVQRLVESRGQKEHRIHIGNKRDIPIVQWLVESLGS